MDKYLLSEDMKGIAVLDEASLIKSASSDPTVFKQLYLAHIRPIYRYIYSKVGEARQAEDLTAQVFLEALESLPRYRHQGHFAAWLFGIAQHKVVDHYRSRRPELSMDDIDRESYNRDDPITSLIQSEEQQRLAKLIRQLDEQDQELLRLRYAAELSFGEIASLIHSNMDATKKRFYRLLTHLRQQLELEHD